MEIPTIQRPDLTGGAPATGAVADQAESLNGQAGTRRPAGKDLPEALRETLRAFETAKAAFLGLRSQLEALQARADRQKGMAADAEAEAEEHKTAVFELIRGETEDKDALRSLTTKQETALSLAIQYRSFADEILAQKEALRDSAKLAAADYLSAWEKALSQYAEAEYKSIMEEIEGKLLQAFAVKRLAYYAVHPVSVQIGYKLPLFDEFKEDFAKRLEGFALDIASDDVLTILAKTPNIDPFKRADFKNPLEVARLRQTVKAVEPMQECA